MSTDANSKPIVVVGLLGSHKDAGVPRRASRWDSWRPSLSILQQEDLLVARFELLHQGQTPQLVEELWGDMASVSPETEVRPHLLEFSDPWDFEGVYGALHGWTTGYEFQAEDEDYLIHITTGTHVAQICLFLLTESRHLPGRLLQTSPPKRQGRPGNYSIIDLDLSRYDQIAARFSEEHREGVEALKSGIKTRNRRFNAQVDLMERVAISSTEPILLQGPTGAGKSSIARRIYELRKKRQLVGGALVDVNCATLRGDLAASTLFGHRRGAFTGATSDREGLLRSADDGLLFLDEIGELGLDEQAMLLRALEEQAFFPVGSDVEVQSSFQLIAGTNRDLRVAVEEGLFREDLLSRINLWTFDLPALKDRLEDLEPNLEFELSLYLQRHGRRVTFNKEARDLYLKFATGPDAHWVGNFRDLNASVTRLCTLASSGRITVEEVHLEIDRLRAAWKAKGAGEASEDDRILSEVLGDRARELDLFDRLQLAGVIRTCRECRSLSDAGRQLFSVSMQQRKSRNDADRLRKYLRRFDLDWQSVR